MTPAELQRRTGATPEQIEALRMQWYERQPEAARMIAAAKRSGSLVVRHVRDLAEVVRA